MTTAVSFASLVRVSDIEGKCSSLLPLTVGQKPCNSIVQPFSKLTSLLGHSKVANIADLQAHDA